MEKNFTLKEFSQKPVTGKGILSSLLGSASFLALFAGILVCFASSSAAAQGAFTGAPGEVVGISDLVRPEWRPVAEFTTVIAEERANTALLLAAPNLKDSQVALYKGYDRMLGYIQNDLTLQLPIDNLTVSNRDKVMLETPNDPELVKMSGIEFQVMYHELVEKLIRK